MFKDMFSIRDRNEKVNTVENVNAENFEKMIKEDGNCVLIDVRSSVENKMLRIPNSLLIDIASPFFIPELNKLDRNKNYYVYCQRGNRSFNAGNQMLKMGFKNVCHLQPGIIGWKGETEQDIF
jgi:phage shock protein E